MLQSHSQRFMNIFVWIGRSEGKSRRNSLQFLKRPCGSYEEDKNVKSFYINELGNHFSALVNLARR